MRRRADFVRGLGVDLVEYKKAKKFYGAHRLSLGDYFGKSEVSFIQGSAKPHEALALLFAAKEAVFKSSDLAWMGPQGFRKTRVLTQKSRQFSFLRSLSFFKGKNYVVAECR